MTPVRYIRQHVFGGIPQWRFAKMIGRRQATVSGWEAGRTDVGLADLRAMRRAAKLRRLPWEDEIPFLSEKVLVKRDAELSKQS